MSMAHRGGFASTSRLALAAAFVTLLAASPASAKTFEVNSKGDEGDLVADGRCDADPSNSKVCTLRAAIDEANATSRPDLIEFDIGGTGVRTIIPQTELPDIINPVTINGYSQPGASPNTKRSGDNAHLKIVLQEPPASNLAGLRIACDDNVIRGLNFESFFSSLPILGTDHNRIQGNFIGTDVTGSSSFPSDNSLFLAEGTTHTLIGGTSPGARNLVSGNGFGIIVSDAPGGAVTSNNRVVGNYIGTDHTGTKDLGNADWGVIAEGVDNRVGGRKAAAANVIAFNGQTNQVDGIFISDTTSTGTRILRNSIFSNAQLGIDLGTGGTTPNDVGDGDPGANGLQNFPTVTSAKRGSNGTKIKGSLNSTALDKFTIQLFANPAGGAAQAKNYLGQVKVTSDVDGNASFSFKTSERIHLGRRITATATGPEGTSEISAPETVVAP
jgi:titin